MEPQNSIMSIHYVTHPQAEAIAPVSGPAVYEAIPRMTEFDRMADPARYVGLPDDWIVGVADVVGSTQEIAAQEVGGGGGGVEGLRRRGGGEQRRKQIHGDVRSEP